MTQRPVLIIGGGIGGLTAALALAEVGQETRIFEAAESIPFGELSRGHLGR